MSPSLADLKDELLKLHPDSSLEPLSSDKIEKLQRKYRGIPADFLDFLRVVGAGNIGRCSFKIYGGFIEPSEVYDPVTADKLDGIYLVGDDFSGYCVGYDTKKKWKIGEVSSNGIFGPIHGN